MSFCVSKASGTEVLRYNVSHFERDPRILLSKGKEKKEGTSFVSCLLKLSLKLSISLN